MDYNISIIEKKGFVMFKEVLFAVTLLAFPVALYLVY